MKSNNIDKSNNNTKITKINLKNKKITILILILIILVQVGVRVFVGYKKEYFHMDEAYSYGLMNYDKINITDNKDFYDTWHTKDYYKDYLTINSNEVCNLKPVYENQKNDVHPPLYYLLLRIASSFAVNDFTKWTGLILNIIIYIVSSIFIFLISRKLLKSDKKALFTCLISGLTLGALDTSAYIRMYELANMFILISTYIHMNIYEKNELKFKDLALIYIVTLLSSLTHYYTLIYIGVLFIIFVIKYIKQKQYKNLLKYVLTFILAAITSLAIFPYSINHIFMGYRGAGAKTSFSISKILTALLIYIAIVCKNLVGGIYNAGIILITLIITSVIGIKKNKKIEKKEISKLIAIPVLVYFIIVSQITPYKELRYMMPIISVLMIYTIYIVDKVLNKNLKENIAKILLCIIFVFTTISPIFTKEHLDFTYTNMNHLADKIEVIKDIPALYIFNENNNRFLDDIYLFTIIDNSYIMNLKNANIENIQNVLSDKNIEKGIILVLNEGFERQDLINNIKEKFDFKNEEVIQNLNAGIIMRLY